MANFVLLYSGGGVPENPAEQEKAMQEWGIWFGKLGSALVDGGNPFTPMAKEIASDGTVSDVPSATMTTGYSIIQANSLGEAVEMAKGCPNLQGGQVSVYETLPVM